MAERSHCLVKRRDIEDNVHHLRAGGGVVVVVVRGLGVCVCVWGGVLGEQSSMQEHGTEVITTKIEL